MESSHYPLSYSTWGPEEQAAIARVIASGQYSMHKEVAQFEKKFADYFGHRYAVMVNSGSSANLLAVAALRWSRNFSLKEGDEVLVPALAWATTYAPLQQFGLKIRVVDIDLQTLGVDPELLERAVTPKTRLIVGVSVLGNPAALRRLRQLADRKGLIFLEDNCESLGAMLEGKPTGTFGHISTCRFFFAHHISTMEGGIVCTEDRELYELCLCMRAHGWTRNLPKDSILVGTRNDSFEQAYRFILPGFNFRPLEFSGAIGLEQLAKLNQMVEIRRKNAEYFKERIGGDTRFFLQRENGQSSWYCFTLIVNPNSDLTRSRLMQSLSKNGIDFRLIAGGNVMRHEYAKVLGAQAVGELKNADLMHDNGIFVGNGPIDLRKNIDHLAKALESI